MAITKLNFTQNESTGKYEAAFTATQDFALYIKGEEGAQFALRQKHPSATDYSEGEYLHKNPYDGDISCGSSEHAYPKDIMLTSSKPVVEAFYE